MLQQQKPPNGLQGMPHMDGIGVAELQPVDGRGPILVFPPQGVALGKRCLPAFAVAAQSSWLTGSGLPSARFAEMHTEEARPRESKAGDQERQVWTGGRMSLGRGEKKGQARRVWLKQVKSEAERGQCLFPLHGRGQRKEGVGKVGARGRPFRPLSWRLTRLWPTDLDCPWPSRLYGSKGLSAPAVELEQ